MSLFIEPTLCHVYNEVFADFLEILRSRNCDFKTTHNTFRGGSMHFQAFFSETFLETSVYLWSHPIGMLIELS